MHSIFWSSWEEDWNYDPLGNWNGGTTGYLEKTGGATTLNQNRAHNTVNEITDITESSGTAWPTPSHDANGNMTGFPQPLSPGNSFEGEYDGWNRLVQVRNGTTVVAGYAYDGASRRVSKTTGTLVRHYYYSDQWQVLEERLSTTGTERKYLWGIRSVDDLIWRERVEGSGPGSSSSSGSGPGLETLYALSDAMGSVTAITDTAGNVLERYGYDGFGSVRYMTGTFVARTGSSYTWETLFDGYRYDAESGLYQVRYRYLHPKLGRWTSRDPIEEEGGLNLYGMVGNNPINETDPFGLWQWGWPPWGDPKPKQPENPPKPPSSTKPSCPDPCPDFQSQWPGIAGLGGKVGGPIGKAITCIEGARCCREGCEEEYGAASTLPEAKSKACMSKCLPDCAAQALACVGRRGKP